jgi:hypothetical protein
VVVTDIFPVQQGDHLAILTTRSAITRVLLTKPGVDGGLFAVVIIEDDRGKPVLTQQQEWSFAGKVRWTYAGLYISRKMVNSSPWLAQRVPRQSFCGPLML